MDANLGYRQRWDWITQTLDEPLAEFGCICFAKQRSVYDLLRAYGLDQGWPQRRTSKQARDDAVQLDPRRPRWLRFTEKAEWGIAMEWRQMAAVTADVGRRLSLDGTACFVLTKAATAANLGFVYYHSGGIETAFMAGSESDTRFGESPDLFTDQFTAIGAPGLDSGKLLQKLTYREQVSAVLGMLTVTVGIALPAEVYNGPLPTAYPAGRAPEPDQNEREDPPTGAARTTSRIVPRHKSSL